MDEPGIIPDTTPHVLLDVPALLGTLTTPEGLGPPNFEATSVGLLNAEGGGFLTNPPIPTFELAEIEELIAPRRTMARQIDFLFVSERLEVVSAEMVMNRDLDGLYPSDHFGILAVLRLRAATDDGD